MATLTRFHCPLCDLSKDSPIRVNIPNNDPESKVYQSNIATLCEPCYTKIIETAERVEIEIKVTKTKVAQNPPTNTIMIDSEGKPKTILRE